MGDPGSIQTRTHSTWPQNIWPPRLVRELFPAGHMTEENEVGATPGHLAAQLALVSTMQAFLHAGFDISLTDRGGDAVLFYALHGDRDMIGYLLGAGGTDLRIGTGIPCYTARYCWIVRTREGMIGISTCFS